MTTGDQLVRAAESKDFNAGLEAALSVISEHLNFWLAKRARTHYPVGMVETELRDVEQGILKRKRK